MTAIATERSVMCELNESGDTRVEWDSENAEEVAAARASFDRLKAKGYKAFRVTKSGDSGELLREFDKHAERIILVPQYQGG